MMTDYLECLQKERITAQQNVSLKTCCSFRIGGIARLVVLPDTTEALCRAVTLAVECGVRFVVIGNGTNLLFADEGFDGAIIRTTNLKEVKVIGSAIIADCGLPLSRLSTIAQNHSLTGLEFAHGIPGNCGGSIFMNAGAFGHELCEVLDSCMYFDARENRLLTVKASQIRFSYRHSDFMENPHRIILRATFQLQPGDMAQIANEMAAHRQARMERQPIDTHNAGSTFKRTEGAPPAGKLIDDCGLKGVSVGDAVVSTKHAGFIVNRGNATAQDVLTLIEYIQTTVYETFQVQLEPEIRYII